MFGHQNNDQGSQRTINPLPPMEPPKDEVINAPFNPALPSPGSSFGAGTPSPAAPIQDVITNDSGAAIPAEPASDTSSDSVTPSTPVAPDDLMDIKQQALSQLSPLVGHLDQTPEEKFRTTMMMIQASDNQDLVKDAYAAAQQITDEKAKAQALLDIVNEINYFTQHHQG